jgi:hypothetical protein
MHEDDDSDLLRLYRSHARELPPVALDAKILAAARTSHARWWLLATAAVAACLVLAFQTQRHPQTQPHPTARYVPGGLYDGQAAGQLADPQLMRQQAIMQLPGGSDGGRENGL